MVESGFGRGAFGSGPFGSRNDYNDSDEQSPMSIVQTMKSDVADAGEVHATIEEHDEELEIRSGQVTWHLSDGYFAVATATDEIMVGADRVVSYRVPDEIWH